MACDQMVALGKNKSVLQTRGKPQTY